jgi:hypothetical protein
MPGASLEGIDPLARTCAHFGFGKSALLPLFQPGGASVEPASRQEPHPCNTVPPLQPRHRRDVSFRSQPSIHRLGRFHRRGDGLRNHVCRRPAPHACAFRHPSSDNLTVPFGATMLWRSLAQISQPDLYEPRASGRCSCKCRDPLERVAIR